MNAIASKNAELRFSDDTKINNFISEESKA